MQAHCSVQSLGLWWLQFPDSLLMRQRHLLGRTRAVHPSLSLSYLTQVCRWKAASAPSPFGIALHPLACHAPWSGEWVSLATSQPLAFATGSRIPCCLLWASVAETLGYSGIVRMCKSRCLGPLGEAHCARREKNLQRQKEITAKDIFPRTLSSLNSNTAA